MATMRKMKNGSIEIRAGKGESLLPLVEAMARPRPTARARKAAIAFLERSLELLLAGDPMPRRTAEREMQTLHPGSTQLGRDVCDAVGAPRDDHQLRHAIKMLRDGWSPGDPVPPRPKAGTAYEAQVLNHDGKKCTDYRITHIATDSRIASCSDVQNAKLIVDALNAFDPEGKAYP
jgi:hypothetical protein